MGSPESVETLVIATERETSAEEEGIDRASAGELRKAVDAIAKIDLTSVNQRLCQQREWSDEKCREVEAGYRRFLVLALLHASADLVPSSEVDEYWHMHILDTRAYQRDCLSSLGFFLHHQPSTGSDTDTESVLNRAFGRTQWLEKQYFGTHPQGLAAKCRLEDGSRCMKVAVS